MADVEVRLTIDNTELVKRATEQAILIGLEAVGLRAEGYAKLELENDPRRIDTGNLRNSITHQVSNAEKAVYIGTNVEYAPYVHEGTSKMAPNRFLKNAATNHTSEYKRIFEEQLERLSDI